MADINKNDLVGKRLTWSELIDNFPSQWVGLVDVKYKDDDGVTIESGILKFINKTQSEMIELAVERKCDSRYIPNKNERPEVIIAECGIGR